MQLSITVICLRKTFKYFVRNSPYIYNLIDLLRVSRVVHVIIYRAMRAWNSVHHLESPNTLHDINFVHHLENLHQILIPETIR